MQIDPKKPKPPISLRVPSEVRTRLERLAKKRGLRLGPYVARILEEHVRSAAA